MTASVAGAQFGFALVWAVGFSIFATLVLQEMAARLGIIARSGLGEALRTAIRAPFFRLLLLTLVVIGIGGGNAAFEMGNILGASVALAEVSGLSTSAWTLVVGSLAFVLLWSGTYAAIERVLVFSGSAHEWGLSADGPARPTITLRYPDRLLQPRPFPPGHLWP